MESLKNYTSLNNELVILLCDYDKSVRIEWIIGENEKKSHKESQVELETKIQKVRNDIADLLNLNK